MQEAAKTLEKFWSQTVGLLQRIKQSGASDLFWRWAKRRFTFPENPHMGLGYANGSTMGSAVGPDMAQHLVETGRSIVEAGVTDPEIFELVGLLEPKIGPDRISDMTVAIIQHHLLEYTQRVCRELKAKVKSFKYNDGRIELPAHPKTRAYLLIYPRDILRKLPVAFCWEDVDTVCMYNHSLRARVNARIGENWRAATNTAKHKKEELKRVLLDFPEALRDLIQQYRDKKPDAYDFTKDPEGEVLWHDLAEKIASKYPLKIGKQVTEENVVDVVRMICDHFRKLVEDNALSWMFWVDGKHRPERYAQLLFFGVADSYCKANNLDLCPETNSGRGPVDFKMSSGYTKRVIVEVKWSDNPKLLHGYETQVEEYTKAEQPIHRIFLIIQVTATDASIKRVETAATSAIKAGKNPPEIKVVDGRRKASASTFEDAA